MQNYTETVLSYFKKENYAEALSLSREFISKYEYYLPAHILAVKAAYTLKENSLAERIISEMPMELMSSNQREELINHLHSFILYGKHNNYESLIEKAKIFTSEKSERYEELYDELEEEDLPQSYPINEQMAHILIAQGMKEPAREILEKLISLHPENEEHYKEIINAM
ncbi:MAG: tetratricopeptide repeat protein [bacterium]